RELMVVCMCIIFHFLNSISSSNVLVASLEFSHRDETKLTAVTNCIHGTVDNNLIARMCAFVVGSWVCSLTPTAHNALVHSVKVNKTTSMRHPRS
ncbi:hypothetical protein L9F63_010223, partial [Diploptera punctata]